MGGGGKRRKRRREGRRARRGNRAARGGGCKRRRALAPRVSGCRAETQAPPLPLRAAPRSHCCGRWRGARGRGAPGLWGGETMPSGKGGLAASKASPDANSQPGLGRVECKGIAAWVGVEGVDGVWGRREAWRGPPSAFVTASMLGSCQATLPPLLFQQLLPTASSNGPSNSPP